MPQVVLSTCTTGFHLAENAYDCLLLLPPVYHSASFTPCWELNPGLEKYSSNTSSPRQDSRYCLTYWSLQGTELTFLLKGRERGREKRLGELAQ